MLGAGDRLGTKVAQGVPSLNMRHLAGGPAWSVPAVRWEPRAASKKDLEVIWPQQDRNSMELGTADARAWSLRQILEEGQVFRTYPQPQQPGFKAPFAAPSQGAGHP